jgi:protoporphyrinogen oxidase
MNPLEEPIVVIGGGYTGLACLTRLLQLGYTNLTLIEKENRLGGLASGYNKVGWDSTLENYYHHWFQSDRFIKKYLKAWGAKPILFKKAKTVIETSHSGFVSLDSPMALLRYPELGFFSKWRMGTCLFLLKCIKKGVFLEKFTAKEWCIKWMGESGYRAIWQPLLIGKFGSHAEKINMAWLWARIHCRTSQLGTYPGGMQCLVDEVGSWLIKRGVKIHLEKPVARINVEEDGVSVISEAGQEFRAKRLVVCAPTSLTEKWLQCDVKHNSKSLGARVVIFESQKSLSDAYWVSFNKSETVPYLAVIEHTNFIDRALFGGRHIIYVADYLSVDSEEWNWSSDKIKCSAILACQKINPNFKEEDVLSVKIIQDKYAQPICYTNESRNIGPLEVNGYKNIFHGSLAHVYPWDRGTNFALELGEKLANLLHFANKS